MILSSQTINATDKIVKTPNGVVVPFEFFQKMNIDIEQKDQLQKELMNCKTQSDYDRYMNDKSSMQWFGAGAALGAILVFALRK